MYNIYKVPIPPSRGNNHISPQIKRNQTVPDEQSFGSILKQKIQDKDLKISQHAQLRLNARNIKLNDDQMEKLKNAVDRAEQKGVKESLILINDIAFIVSIKNRTVITAIDGPSVKENVFTNIDGAVVL
jgi:flagellar operon protein